MFTIYANGKVLASSHIREPYVVEDPKVTVEKGKTSNFQFSIYATHPMYYEMEKMVTYVDVYLDYGYSDRNECIFSGRILHTEASEDGKMSVYCEGCYAYLVDSVFPPDETKEGPAARFEKIIEMHNSQVEGKKQFIIGEMDFGEKVEEREYSGSAYRNCQEAIQNDLIDIYGGYIRCRKLGTDLYIDYLQDTDKKSSQKIRFQQNLLAYQDSITGEDLFTILYPIGANIEVQSEEEVEPNPEESPEEEEPWTPPPIESVKIGSVNDGSDLLENQELINRFGRITKVQIFDSAETPEDLLEQAREYMDRYSFGLLQMLTITAIDLKNFDIEAESIKVGDVIGVILPFYSKEIELICTEIEYSLNHPEDNQYTLGEQPQDLSAKYDSMNSAVSSVSSTIKDNTNTVNRVVERVGQMGKDININAKNIQINANNIQANANQIELNAKDIIANAEKIQANADQIEINTKNLDLKASDADLVWVKDKVTDIETDNSSLHKEQERLMTRMGNVEIDINGGEGYVGLKTQYANLYGDWTKFKDEDYSKLKNQVDEAGEWIATADVEINAMEGKIAAKVDATYVDDSLTKYDNDVQLQLSALEGKIDLKASSEQVSELSTKYNNVEIELNSVKDTIKLKADSSELKGFKDDLSDLETRIGKAEITLNGEEGSIGLVGQFAKLDGDWTEFQGDYSTLKNQVKDVNDRVSTAEIKVNAMEGTIEAKADVTYVDSTKSTIETNVKAELDAQKGLIDLKADTKTVNGISDKLSSVEIRMSTAENNILLRATKEETDKLSDRVKVNEGWIEVNDSLIQSHVSEITKLKQDVDGGFIEDMGERKYKPGLKDKVDLGYTYMGPDGEPVVVPALTERVLVCESDIKQTKDEITLTVRKGDIISSINQSAEAITINAAKVNLVGYVTASKLEAEIATLDEVYAKKGEFDNLYASKASFDGLTSGNSQAKNLWTGGLTADHIQVSGNATITGDLTIHGFDFDTHRHMINDNGDGTFSIGGPAWANVNSFKIADTKTYKDGVSAAAKSVTVTGAWSGGRYTATLSNDYSVSTYLTASLSGTGVITYNSTSHKYDINLPINYTNGPGGSGGASTGYTVSGSTGTQAYDAGYSAGEAAGSSSGIKDVYVQLNGSGGTSFTAQAYSDASFDSPITGASRTGYLYISGSGANAKAYVGRSSSSDSVASIGLSSVYESGRSDCYAASDIGVITSNYDGELGVYNLYIPINSGDKTGLVRTTSIDVSAAFDNGHKQGYSSGYSVGKSAGISEGEKNVKVRLSGDGHSDNFSAQTYVGTNPSTASTITSIKGYLYTTGSTSSTKACVGTSNGSGTIAQLNVGELYSAGRLHCYQQMYVDTDSIAYNYDGARGVYNIYIPVVSGSGSDKLSGYTGLYSLNVNAAFDNGYNQGHASGYADGYEAGKNAAGTPTGTISGVRLEGTNQSNFSATIYKADGTPDTAYPPTKGYLYIKAPPENLKFGSRVYVGKSADSDPVAQISLDDFYASVAYVEWSNGHTAGWNDGYAAGKEAAGTTSGTISGVRLEGTNQPNFDARIYNANGTPATEYTATKGYLYLDGADENQTVHVGTSPTSGTVAQLSVKSVYEDGESSVYVPTQSANIGTYWSATNNAQHYITVKVKLSNGRTFQHSFKFDWVNG